MPVYVALLRAVNVGGTGALPMAELKVICERLSFHNVETYIQSGNVLFRSDETGSTLERRLDEALARTFGQEPGVMVRRRKEVQKIR
ncbi:DUF1697 domain-containing protein, partial [Rhizobium sp. SEMIA 4085]|uniref:DUF1697 domain-containing protein n=1 Tax=Rhizobium sp. SEMIA 4085 TaxID=2137761 RepID=UPI001478BD43